jgi:hypothetical protein
MMDAASTLEMMVNFNQTTWCNISDDSVPEYVFNYDCH